MAKVGTLNFVDVQRVFAAWAAGDGPSEEEKLQFANDAIKELDSGQDFADNVKQAGVAANQVDDAFDKVTRSFEDMAQKYGAEFPGISTFLNQWKGYNANWVAYLSESRDVASKNIVILRRFDQIFLEMVETIASDQDRLDVIKELERFIVEDHDDGAKMSAKFLELKRDVEAFAGTPATETTPAIPGSFEKWIAQQGQKLIEEAEKLKLEIEALQSDIQALDKQIQDATTALVSSGAALNILGVIIAGSLLAVYQKRRNDKAKELQNKKNDLAYVNEKQEKLAHLQAEFEGVKPQFALICEKLVLFSQIWLQVQSQAVQFQAHLRTAPGAETNIGFKAEVRLARKVCLPLMDGLEKYATELGTRANKAKK